MHAKHPEVGVTSAPITSAVERAYGIVFKLTGIRFLDLQESLELGGICFDRDGDVLTVGFDNADEEPEAEGLAQLTIASWALRHRTGISTVRVHSWRPAETGGEQVRTGFEEKLTTCDRLTFTHTRYVEVQAFLSLEHQGDSASFAVDLPMAQKALHDAPLADALRFYIEEVANVDRPLYGIYKALERLAVHLGGTNKGAMGRGKKALAALVNEPVAYVDDIMSTAQVERHAVTAARRKLEDSECQHRAARLIEHYARSLY